MKTNPIGWCHRTINVFHGCTFGCTYCYARDTAKRQRHNCQTCYDFKPHLHLERLRQITPKQKPQRIFVGSMSDIAEFVWWHTPDDWDPPSYFTDEAIREGKKGIIDLLIQWFKLCSQHTFIMLTKRPEALTLHGIRFPANVWVGVTVDNVAAADRYRYLMEHDLAVAHNYFISFEPLQEDVVPALEDLTLSAPEWIIIGGMSRRGKDPLPPDPQWVANLMDWSFEIPIYMKENIGLPGNLMLRQFPPSMPVYDGEVKD